MENAGKKGGVKVRRWKPEDIPEIARVQRAAYPRFEAGHLCSERHLSLQLAKFPDGQILAEVDGKIVGYAAALIVQLSDASPWYSYSEITGAGTFSTHNPSGDTLYGADIAVHPDYRGRGIAGKLYEGRKKLLKRYNLRRMVAGGRIPGYADHAGKMTAEEYVELVKKGILRDMALNAHLKAGYEVRSVHMNYLADEASVNYATFLEMKNENFNPARHKIAASPIVSPIRKVRVCAAQYQMRRISSWEEFEKQVEFFVASADEYHCHFLVYPELFTAQLYSLMPPNLDSEEAIEVLADQYTDLYISLFSRLAHESGIHIIAGSHPIRTEDGLKNVSHLFTPSRNVYTQEKLHITPEERKYYGIVPGDRIRIFDTGLARIAIAICYDVEFPELARLLTLAGVEILFVPFSTDERKAYTRVRASALARAIENNLYVLITGNVGNLPQVRSFLINYGQAAVFTPSDFAFPLNATAAEAQPNIETIVVTDLDLGDLVLVRELGSVTHLRDRRSDLYKVTPSVPVEIVRTT